MPPVKKWGIYVYFAADVRVPAMQRAAWRTLKTLASVGSSSSVGITALIDLPDRATEYYVFPQRPADPCVRRWPVEPDRFLPNVDSASIDAVYDFFQWSTRNCPASNVALIFWGHGYALDDFDPRIQGNDSFAFSGHDDSGLDPALGRSAWTFPGKRGQELKLLYDSTHNSVLNNREFADALRGYSIRFRDGKPIQVLGLDCCNMAMAEVVCELQDCAEYLVAAETSLPFQSWLTAPVLQRFINDEYPNAEVFAKHAVEDFIGSFGRASGTYIGLSVCHLKACKQLENAMRNMASELYKAIGDPAVRFAIRKAWFSDVSFVLDGIIDLASFCNLLQLYLPQSTEATAARGVEAAVAELVLLSKTAPDLPGRKIKLSRGLSFWFPPWIQHPAVEYFQINQSRDYLFHGYPQTRFAQATGWDQFLRKLLYLTQGQ